MTSAVVFVGPSASSEEVARLCPAADHRPPAGLGDVYAAVNDGAGVIGLVDGVFETRPSVWHKEILWAMHKGVHVLGAASMGALRAAETEPFGMQGVGQVYEDFRSGRLVDDDEVAVAHADASAGFRATSVAMVDLRASLRAAVEAHVLSEGTARALEGLAKSTFFVDRSHETMLRSGRESDLDPQQLDGYRAWWPTHQVRRKHEDALLLLDRIAVMLAEGFNPLQVAYQFEYTDMWDRFVATHTSAQGLDDQDRVLTEVRLAGPTSFKHLRERALSRILAEAEGRRHGLARQHDGDMESVSRRLRDLGIPSERADQWVGQGGMRQAQLGRMLLRQELTAWADQMWGTAVTEACIEVLRLDGSYEPLEARARAKRRELTERGLVDARPEEIGRSRAELWSWYFAEKVGIEPPDDPHRYARELGYERLSDLEIEIVREYCWSTHC